MNLIFFYNLFDILQNLGVIMNTINYYEHLIKEVKNYCQEEGLIDTPIESLKFYITTAKTEFSSIIYEPSLCIALQGEKEIGYGDESYTYSPSKYLLMCTNIPANVRIKSASKQSPYVSVLLKFSLEQIYEVIKESNYNRIERKKKLESAFCFNKLDEELLEPITRLIKLLSKPEKDRDFISKLLIKEIIYVLLQNNSDFLKHYVLEGTLTSQIVKAISEIKNNYQETINMKNLANNIGISESTLYQNFKKITLMSPLQYQKKIRLEEAKNMLVNQNIEASQVAYKVGYESPSQFSREYARMFGLPPKAHISKLKTVL